MKEIGKFTFKLVVFGTILSASFLSFGGIFALPATLAVFRIIPRDMSAKLSSFFSAAIEGTIYKQNADAAINFSLERGIAKRLLKNLGKKNPPINNSFLQDYMAQNTYLHELEEGLDEFDDKETAEREINAVESRLASMEDLFMSEILSTTPNNSAIELNPLEPAKNNDIMTLKLQVNELAIQQNKQSITQEINRKYFQLLLSKIASLGAGLCCSLVTYAAFQEGLLDLGFKFIPATALIGGSVISILAGTGYLLLMYRTLSYLVQSEAVKKWLQRGKDFFYQEKDIWDWIKGISLGLFFAIAIIGTLATVGTWFYLGAIGASSFLSPTWAAIASITTWICMLVPTFLYNIINTLQSVDKLPSIFKEFWKKTCEDFAEAWRNENILQFINPARVATKFSKIIIFLGHIIATGAGSACDHNPFIASPEIAIAANAITEGTTDLHQIADSHGHEEEEKKATNGKCDGHAHNSVNGHGHSHGTPDTSKTKRESEEEDDSHHHHGAIILDEVIWVCKSASVLWDYALGNWLGVRPLIGYLVPASGYSHYAHEDAYHKFFPTKRLPTAPGLSEEWKRYDLNKKIDEEISYYNKNDTSKASTFSYIKDQLKKSTNVESFFSPTTQGSISSLPAKHSSNLSTHRHWFRVFSSKPPVTRAEEVTESLIKDRCLNPQAAPGG